jgi:hypothetical protein
MTEKVYKGRTEDAEAPFLSADFWKPGTKIAGMVDRVFMAGEQKCYGLSLLTPVAVDGEETNQVSLGSMAGLRMALQAARLSELQARDRVVIVCTGKTPSKKEGNSPRVDFEVEVTRAMAAF